MTSTRRVLSALAMAPLVAGVVLAGTVGTAGAEKPQRGCPPSFDQVSRAALAARFGEREDFEALFDAIDKNDDGLLCGKPTPGLYNTVDNVANR